MLLDCFQSIDQANAKSEVPHHQMHDACVFQVRCYHSIMKATGDLREVVVILVSFFEQQT